MNLNRYLIKIGICIATMFLSLACTKEDPIVNEPNEPQDPNAAFFSWRLDGGTQVHADSAVSYEQSHVIFAYEHGGGSLEIILSEMKAGTYNISTATGNQLTYTQDNTMYETTGTVNISSSTISNLSGSFDCAFKSGPYKNIKGEFKDIPKR